mgnify:FL=1
MTNLIIASFLLLLAIAGVVIRKTYSYVPLRELKRRAENHDPLATKLYPAASYDNSLQGLLWAFIIITSASGVILLSRVAPIWLSAIAVPLLIWAVYSWLPSTRTTTVGIHLTSLVNPILVWILNHTHSAIDRPTSAVADRYVTDEHTGLFERDDLLDLIEQQQHQHDSRFTESELEIAKRALSFGDYSVGEIMTPKKMVKSVSVDNVVGPVLIDELHKSQQDYILVRESPKGDFVGTLAYKSLGLHSSGKVKEYMSPDIYYVHENDNLGEALQTFFATNRPLFIVLNNEEEYIGVVTITSILRQLLGHMPGEDFEQYGDPTAVVERHKKLRQAAANHKEQTEEHEVEFIDDPEETEDEENVELDENTQYSDEKDKSHK